jgi:glucose-1-phosphate thymidylyltransferase
MLGGITDILIITTPEDNSNFKGLLGNGKNLGLNIQYETQKAPRGIAEAFLIGEKFINGEDVTLCLGDNLFHGDLTFFRKALENHQNRSHKLTSRIFAYQVQDPERYGIVEFDKKTGAVLNIEEKPQTPKSNFAVPGLYIYDETVVEKVKTLKPSPRGELEITDLNNLYLQENKLGVETINRGVAWLDTGTPQALHLASSYIQAIQERQGQKVACLEEVALRMKFIDTKQFEGLIEKIPSCTYREYLVSVLDNY